MNESLAIQLTKHTNHDSNLGRIVVFLPMLYFVIGNGDCIKIEKKNWNSKIRLLKVLGEFAKL